MCKQHLALGTRCVDLSLSWDVLYLFVIVTSAFCALFCGMTLGARGSHKGF